MPDKKLYQLIADKIQQAIHTGELAAGDMLPSVREMAQQWSCSPATVQRAYQHLSEIGVVTSRSGQGTRVSNNGERRDLRVLKLVNRAESFILEQMSAGYAVWEVEQALKLALDGVRGRRDQISLDSTPVLRFAGSHDSALALALTHISQTYPLEIAFVGSMNGLMALSDERADIAGCHLWDSATDTYNKPFIRRLFAGREVAVLTIAHRRLGIITSADNSLAIQSLVDLTRDEVRFVNRQFGAGTRVWLEHQLRTMEIEPQHIRGFEREVNTHAEVARLIASGEVDVGIGIEAVAAAYKLNFIPLNVEKYDLVIPSTVWSHNSIKMLVGYLQLDSTRRAFSALGGYSTQETGILDWIR